MVVKMPVWNIRRSKVKKSDNPKLAAAFKTNNWVLNFTDPRFFNKTFYYDQYDIAKQEGTRAGFTPSELTKTDNTYYYFTAWFGATAPLPKGTQFTVTYYNNEIFYISPAQIVISDLDGLPANLNGLSITGPNLHEDTKITSSKVGPSTPTGKYPAAVFLNLNKTFSSPPENSKYTIYLN